ncbi:hypothetical protein DERF_005783 [Dermatophagoides farinae]|uniref:Uncharacterized protein n=1 Tax=Dermatophagoides farinae TaxID=6954 RepID=A0A922I6A9_DERFA|nr:hypothetical protein DERF_005783 [Dermatophagoides farinae]
MMMMVTMLSSIITIVIATAAECDAKKVDKCMLEMTIIGDSRLRFPTNQTMMNDRCRQMRHLEHCVKDYSKNCLAERASQTVSVLIYGITKTNKAFCSKKRRPSYLRIGRCANSQPELFATIMNRMTKAFHAIKSHPKETIRIPLACCNYYQFKDSIMQLVEKICPNEYDDVETLLDGYANDVLNLICGDYTADSDKCDSIIMQTPEWKRPLTFKSFVIPLAQIIDSI